MEKKFQLDKKILITLMIVLGILILILGIYFFFVPRFRVQSFSSKVEVSYNEEFNYQSGKVCYGTFFHCEEVEIKEEGTVEEGNVAVIDFEGFIDGVPFEGGKAENFSLEIGSNTFVPGFEEQLIGMKSNEESDIKITFPQNYVENLSGKEATFKVKLHEIKKKELPELDDEFAKDVSEFDTLADLKADIKAKLEKENEEKAKYESEEAAIEAVCKEVEIDIPSGMIETETENMLKDIETRLSVFIIIVIASECIISYN